MFLYHIGITVYGLLLRIVSLWHRKAAMWVRGRRGWQSRLHEAMRGVEAPVVWFHCASLGEFEQGRPLMEAFVSQHPTWRLVVSFFSPSGYNVRRNYPLAHYVCYLPLDTPRNARAFVRILSPSLAIFVKYELWYNTLRALRAQSVPTFLLSATFRPDQMFFKSYGGSYREWLGFFDALFVQDDESIALLERVGIRHALRTGDTRFDRVSSAVENAPSVPLLESFAASGPLLVAGSTWPVDEAMLAKLIKRMPAAWRLVVVPHEICPARIAAWAEMIGEPVVLYTHAPTEEMLAQVRVLVVDTVGLLLSIYRYASLAYVGGGFGVGIHNTLEPAAHGVPVLFGPNHERFREARELRSNGGGVSVSSEKELISQACRLMEDTEARQRMSRASCEYVGRNMGATAIVMSRLNPYIARVGG